VPLDASCFPVTVSLGTLQNCFAPLNLYAFQPALKVILLSDNYFCIPALTITNVVIETL
jgi:hypothetical protein